MTTRTLRAPLIAVLLSVGLMAGMPTGPDPWHEDVVRALAAAQGRTAGGHGRQVGATQYGVLAEGGSAIMTVTLREGVGYAVVAACDRDCGRLALEATDPRRYTLDADQSETTRPALRVVPAVTGPHRIVVTMGRCAVDPCRYGVVVVAP
jgi:hypothetical protein